MPASRIPKYDENTLYIEATYEEIEFERIWEKIIEKWPDARLRELSFGARSENIHGCGCHPGSGGDYEHYIKITRSKLK